MKFLYKPFGVMVSVLGGLLAGMVFKRTWRAIAGEDDSPDATDRQRSWGEIVTAAASARGITIRPIDSEHSALWQCLQGAPGTASVRRLLITGSGGPFRQLAA